MKKPYSKPMVPFEEYSLDMPIAAGCSGEHIGDALELEAQGWLSSGYFNELEEACSTKWTSGKYDKLCYYTIADKLFTS